MRAGLPLLALFLIRLTPAIAFQSAAVAAPLLGRSLGLDHAQLGSILGAFTLPGIVVSVLAGMLARRIGDRAVVVGSLVLVAIGAALAGLANGYAGLIGARVLGGIGGVASLMLLIKMVTDRYAGPWLSTASAIIISSWPLGLAVGLLLLGPVPALFGWRATLAAAGVPVLLALLLVPLAGDAPATTTGPAAPAVLPPRCFLLGAILSWSLMNGVLVTMIGFLPSYFVSLGRTIDAAAAATSLIVWVPAFAIPLGGLLADRVIGRRTAVVIGVTATGALLVAIPATGGPAVLLALIGLAFSIAPGPLTAQVGQATAPGARAIVFGWYSAGSYTAMTLAPWIAGWLRDVTGDPAAPLLFAAGLSFGVLLPYALVVRGGRGCGFERVASVPRRGVLQCGGNPGYPHPSAEKHHGHRADQLPPGYAEGRVGAALHRRDGRQVPEGAGLAVEGVVGRRRPP